jgi:DNA-binding MarR family transcriptional regulator
MARKPSKKELEAADRLHSAAIHLLRHVRKEDARAGISAARLSALSVLVFGGSRTIGELADAEEVRPPTITRIVSALEEDGLVRRRPSRDDARSVVVEATPRGRALLQEGRRRRVEALAERLARLPQDELDTLRRAADLIEDALTRPKRQ